MKTKMHIKRRLKFEQEAKQLELQFAGYLPDVYREQFEQRYFSGFGLRRALKNKELSPWRAAQRVILEIQLEPSDWFDEASLFYDWFFKKKYSFGYVCKIIRILNLWGFFISRKLGKPFLRFLSRVARKEVGFLMPILTSAGPTVTNQTRSPEAVRKGKNKIALRAI